MKLTSRHRADPISPNYVGQLLYLDAFSLLRPPGEQNLSLSSFYSLFGCGPLLGMRAGITPCWQSLGFDFKQGAFAGDVVLYSDSELTGFSQWNLNEGLTVFGEGSIKSSPHFRFGVNYESKAIVERAQISADLTSLDVGASLKIWKHLNLICGSRFLTSGRLDTATIGLRFSPCSHFQVSISDVIADGINRFTGTLYAEPQKGTKYAILLATGGGQGFDVLAGVSQAFKNKTFKSFSIKSVVDMKTFGSRHEFILPYKENILRAGLSVGGSLKHLNPQWSLSISINSK